MMTIRRRMLEESRKNRLAKLFSTFEMSSHTTLEQQENYNLGLKLQKGVFVSVAEIVKSISILEILCKQEKISKKEMEDIKIDLVQRMTGFKIVER